jgi:hypothetical protein
MKILFVDIDEVLNSDEHPGGNAPPAEYGDPEYYAQGLDSFHVAILNDIINQTGALIVLSTSWRNTHTLNFLRLIFKVAGCKGFIIGDTPRLFRTPDGEVRYRWHEIQLWLNHVKPEAFCILDDIDDMGPLSDHHIHTTDEAGLQPEHVQRAVEILNR